MIELSLPDNPDIRMALAHRPGPRRAPRHRFDLRNTDIGTLFRSAAFSESTAGNLMQPLLNFGRIRAGIDLAEAQQ